MNISNALKDRKFRESVLFDFILFFVYEFMLYIAYFEWGYDIKGKLYSIVTAGILTVIGIILISIGIVNKNKDRVISSIELFGLSVFTFLSYYVLSYFPNNIKLFNKNIFIFIPFIVCFIYYIIKIIYRFKRKMQR